MLPELVPHPLSRPSAVVVIAREHKNLLPLKLLQHGHGVLDRARLGLGAVEEVARNDDDIGASVVRTLHHPAKGLHSLRPKPTLRLFWIAQIRKIDVVVRGVNDFDWHLELDPLNTASRSSVTAKRVQRELPRGSVRRCARGQQAGVNPMNHTSCNTQPRRGPNLQRPTHHARTRLLRSQSRF